MWLLDTSTLRLHEFFGKDIPEYVILSHRWEDEEVTFKLVRKGRGRELRGWRKIERFCEVVRYYKVDYAWVDTCCIDKTSSAELSEAINSMFKWYKNAWFCLVYLNDVVSEESPENLEADFKKSKWFTRGWTLQELLAPKLLNFFDADWTLLGDRFAFRDEISLATGINVKYVNFFDPYDLNHASVATRMSWAAHRKTQREEDIAYCLMGIFGIHMPLLYGEGGFEAFRRLQIEITKKHDDESIFAWSSSHLCTDMFAMSPRDFASSSNVFSILYDESPPVQETSRGTLLNVSLSVVHPAGPAGPRIYMMPLNCARASNESRLAIYLAESVPRSWGKSVYCRLGTLGDFNETQASGPAKPKTEIFIRGLHPLDISLDGRGRHKGYVPIQKRGSKLPALSDLGTMVLQLEEEVELQRKIDADERSQMS